MWSQLVGLMVSQQIPRADSTNKLNSKQPAIQGQSRYKVQYIAAQIRLVAHTHIAASNRIYKTVEVQATLSIPTVSELHIVAVQFIFNLKPIHVTLYTSLMQIYSSLSAVGTDHLALLAGLHKTS